MYWYDLAERDPIRDHPGLTYISDVPFRIVLHTTQGFGDYHPHRADGSYLGVWTPPQLTVAINGVFQHIDLDRASYAMVNLQGGVQTNLWRALQIEIHWKAEWADDLPLAILDHLNPLLEDLVEHYDVHGPILEFHGSDAYGENAPYRMAFEEWHTFNGICGHQHVPENKHWDPGPINRSMLLPVTTPKEGVKSMFDPELTVAAFCTGPDGVGAIAVSSDGKFWNFGAPIPDPGGALLGPYGRDDFWGNRKVATIELYPGDDQFPVRWKITSTSNDEYVFPVMP